MHRHTCLLLRCSAAAIVIILLVGAEHPRAVTPGDASSGSARSSFDVPLLPVIFFDSASADIPERYDLEPLDQGASAGVYRTLHDAYLRVLDALAEQMLRTKERIVLVGYEDRTDGYGECYLARQRAERVKNYLVHDRGVPSRRIHVIHSNTSCVPPEISSQMGKGSSDEYRRVEILTSDGDPFPIILRLTSPSAIATQHASGFCVMFDVRSSYVRRVYRQQLQQFLDTLPYGSTLSISGMVDAHNGGHERRSLASQREAEVEKLIVRGRADCRVQRSAGHAPRQDALRLPDLDLPELRYLSRVVLIRQVRESTSQLRH